MTNETPTTTRTIAAELEKVIVKLESLMGETKRPPRLTPDTSAPLAGSETGATEAAYAAELVSLMVSARDKLVIAAVELHNADRTALGRCGVQIDVE